MSVPNYVSGTKVWIQTENNNEFSIPIACQILSIDRNKILVQDCYGKEFWITTNDVIKEMEETLEAGVEDMININDLQEYTILHNLHTRYKKKLIYTYTGSMLIAINPYEILPIYSNIELLKYHNQKIGYLPPHIFAIGDNAYQKMCSEMRNQCIVISGDSGAGKTESTKLILKYLTSISNKQHHTWIEEQIIESNPIMEAFGNAKTLRNDNSSRFGKYIDVKFNTVEGVIKGAKIVEYLLEKSRIVSQNHNERNYHIFYSLLAGLTNEQKIQLELEDASKYFYLKQGNCLNFSGRDDFEEFANIRSAMRILLFSNDEVWSIFSLLAAILHFGNLKIQSTITQNMDTSCDIRDSPNLFKISRLLGTDTETLCTSLTKRTIFAQGERVITTLSRETCTQGRDAFVKALYGKIFIQIIKRINQTIFKEQNKRTTFTTQQSPRSTLLSIGILDIFGFENFKTNSFEQLCINYANENLQQFFVNHIFKMEQDEYGREGIEWKHIEFVDNQEILNIIGLKPMNIMSLIDEESKFPKGTDWSLLEKLNSTYGNTSIYVKPKSSYVPMFGIQHYAGVIFYNSSGFLEKNRDFVSLDLREMVANSSNKYLVSLFSSDVIIDTCKKSVTLSMQFRNSLDLLMRTLSACHPFFIRCIKPNEMKSPNDFDRELCVRQLRYYGIMETTKIRKAGYEMRYSHTDFIQRYQCLISDSLESTKNTDYCTIVQQICSKYLSKTFDYQVGKTKVFLKGHSHEILESQRSITYLKYVQLNAVIKIQKVWRKYLARKKYFLIRNGIYRLQARIKSRQQTDYYLKMKHLIIKLQARCRGYLERKKFREIRLNSQKLAIIDNTIKSNSDITEDENSFVDKQFEFLNSSDSRSLSSESSVLIEDDSNRYSVSKMLVFFEKESRRKKYIPHKLLSRPVGFYSYDSRPP